jgi:hypothetical protein
LAINPLQQEQHKWQAQNKAGRLQGRWADEADGLIRQKGRSINGPTLSANISDLAMVKVKKVNIAVTYGIYRQVGIYTYIDLDMCLPCLSISTIESSLHACVAINHSECQ